MTQNDWLMNSGWQSQKENIILIHGYAGGEDTPPIGVLKDGNCILLIYRPMDVVKRHLTFSLFESWRLQRILSGLGSTIETTMLCCCRSQVTMTS